MRCPNSEGGCQWTGTVGTLVNHLASCQFALVPCPNKCEENKGAGELLLTRKHVDEHLKTKCLKRAYECPHCGKKGTFASITEDHDKVCEKRRVACPNKGSGCSLSIERGKTKEHVVSDCEYTKVACIYKSLGCGVRMLRKDKVTHESKAREEHMDLSLANVKLLSTEQKSLTATVKLSEEKHISLEKSIALKDKQHKSLTEGLNKLSKKNETLTKQLKMLSENHDSLSKRNETLTMKLTMLSGKHDSLSNENETLTMKLRLLSGQCDSLSKKNETLTTKLTTLSDKHVSISKKNEILTTKVTMLSEMHDSLSEKNETLTAKIATLSEKHEILSKKHETLLKQHRVLSDTVRLPKENHKVLTRKDKFIFRLSHYASKKELNERFLSAPFYTHSSGCKMCTCIYPNGNGDGKDTHISVFTLILAGHYDNQLHWPFLGTVTYELLNQLEDNNHRSVDTTFIASHDTRVGVNRGYPKFFPHSLLSHNPATNTQYLLDDTLYFRVSLKVDNHKPWLVCTDSNSERAIYSSTEVIFRVPEYNKLKSRNMESRSNSFYTSSEGYLMCIQINANGVGEYKGKHVSVFTRLLEGNFDNQLHWPFQGTVTYELLNQLGDNNHYSRRVSHDASDDLRANSAGNGYSKFIPLSSLDHNPATNTQYLLDDTLYFRVSVNVDNQKPWLVCTHSLNTDC